MKLRQIILTVALALFILTLSPAMVGAQNPEGMMMQDPIYNQPGITGTTGTATEDNRGFDWRWLLPLIAVPFILPFLLKRDNDDTRSEYRRSGRTQTTYHDIDRKRRVDEDI